MVSLLLALLNNYRRILNIKVTMKGNIHLCRYQCLDGKGVAGKGVAIEFFSIFSVKFPTLRTGTLFKLIKYPFLCLTKLQSGTKFVVKREFKIGHYGRLGRLDRCHVTQKTRDLLPSSFWDGMFSPGFSS